MNRINLTLAALVVAAMVSVAPAAHAQTTEQACLNGLPGCNVHVLGAGSSAQFLTAALGADQLAINEISAEGKVGTQCPYHWSAKNSANVVDNRDSRIELELGNVWIVWVAACSDATGNTNVTDLWSDVSVDSTVGNRVYFAQETTGSGAQVQIIPATAGNLIGQALWPDNKTDVNLTTAANVSGAIGTGAAGGLHINVGLTDIRPEDAYFATTRALGTLNTSTYVGLGYKGPTPNIGAPIRSDQGTGTFAVPIKFELGGGTDPITHIAVPPATTIPIGAAPIVFVFNNGNAAYNASSFPTDLASGVTPGEHVAGQAYPLANLFDGTTDCALSNAAFDAFSAGAPPATNVYPVLREPLSGTMNTTEFNLFRTYGNTTDTQEKGITQPLSGSPYNPLQLNCAGGGGYRWRAIGTGEVVNAVAGTKDALGYIFWGFANAAKLAGSKYNYLTIDGVDPIWNNPSQPYTCQGGTVVGNSCAPGGVEACTGGSTCLPTNTPQELPNCTATNCTTDLWQGTSSFPNLRNGTYKAWSLYRWVTASDAAGEADIYGPAHLAQNTQNVIDSSFADYVPFQTTAGPADGLDVYRAHYKQTTLPATTPDNGTIAGSTIGGDNESGGDVGGFVIGPFTNVGGTPVWCPSISGHSELVDVTSGSTSVAFDAGIEFKGTATAPKLNLQPGNTIYLNGVDYTIQTVTSGTALTLTTPYVGSTGDANACFEIQTPGPLAIKQ